MENLTPYHEKCFDVFKWDCEIIHCHYNEFSKICEGDRPNRGTNLNMEPEKIPDRLPSVAIDRAARLMAAVTEMMIQLEMEFAHRLDSERLSRAVRLMLDAQPVLGCRFCEDSNDPYWQRLDCDQAPYFIQTGQSEQYEAFKIKLLDFNEEVQLQVCLFNDTQTDRLLLKVGHVASDTGGVKEICNQLAWIYNTLKTNPDYRPSPNLNGCRDFSEIEKYIPKSTRRRSIFKGMRDFSFNFSFNRSITFPMNDGPEQGLVFFTRTIPADRVVALSGYGRERGATLNDIFLAAFYRAFAWAAKWDGKTQMRMSMTVDLRLHYLPEGKAEGICNLSAIEFPNLKTNLGADFEATLKNVNAITGKMKKNGFGLSQFTFVVPMLELSPYQFRVKNVHRFLRKSVEKGKISPALTNLGPIDEQTVTFDKPAIKAHVLPPPAHPPQIVCGVSGYAGSLTISVGVFEKAMGEVSCSDLFDKVLEELPV